MTQQRPYSIVTPVWSIRPKKIDDGCRCGGRIGRGPFGVFREVGYEECALVLTLVRGDVEDPPRSNFLCLSIIIDDKDDILDIMLRLFLFEYIRRRDTGLWRG